jgi:hypothetical protein
LLAPSLPVRPAQSCTHADTLIKHEAVPKCGSYEVRFPDGTPSRIFYWDDVPSRRLRRELMWGHEAREAARTLPRAKQDRLDVAR